MRKLFLCWMLMAGGAFAELQSITLQWTGALCQTSCQKGLLKEFKKVKSIQDVSLAPGRATITWKEGQPFSYYTVDRVMQMIGLSINTIRVKVRGKISHTNTLVRITSLGDGTKFDLFSPIQPKAGQYTEKYNIQSHFLTGDLKDQLLEAEKADKIVTIEGPLFEAYRSPPLVLIAENVQVKDAEENPPKK